MAFSQSLQQIQDKGANADLISLFKDSGADIIIDENEAIRNTTVVRNIEWDRINRR